MGTRRPIAALGAFEIARAEPRQAAEHESEPACGAKGLWWTLALGAGISSPSTWIKPDMFAFTAEDSLGSCEPIYGNTIPRSSRGRNEANDANKNEPGQSGLAGAECKMAEKVRVRRQVRRKTILHVSGPRDIVRLRCLTTSLPSTLPPSAGPAGGRMA